MRPNQPARARRGFTLIEIMIVITIVAVITTAGIPLMWRALAKDDLARAVNDVMEGCKAARDRAILSGQTHEFVVKENGGLEVVPAPVDRGPGSGPSPSPGSGAGELPSGVAAAFPRVLGKDVMIQLIDVNFRSQMESPEARVRFFSNGTSDEFTVVMAEKGRQRTVTLDIVTGLPEEYIKP